MRMQKNAQKYLSSLKIMVWYVQRRLHFKCSTYSSKLKGPVLWRKITQETWPPQWIIVSLPLYYVWLEATKDIVAWGTSEFIVCLRKSNSPEE
jgi:hypothetical protein